MDLFKDMREFTERVDAMLLYYLECELERLEKVDRGTAALSVAENMIIEMGEHLLLKSEREACLSALDYFCEHHGVEKFYRNVPRFHSDRPPAKIGPPPKPEDLGMWVSKNPYRESIVEGSYPPDHLGSPTIGR